jgi:hypothetical protein
VRGALPEIRLPRPHYATIIGHGWRKVDGHYLEGETAEPMAFGLLAGTVDTDAIHVHCVFPLIVNRRQLGLEREFMDAIVDEYATPSVTPNGRRGWLADPREVLAVERMCDRHGWVTFGSYHTHRVAWPHDPLRDTCTGLDRTLAQDTGQWMFILSVVDMERPIFRAFYEGRNEAEATIHIVADL